MIYYDAQKTGYASLFCTHMSFSLSISSQGTSPQGTWPYVHWLRSPSHFRLRPRTHSHPLSPLPLHHSRFSPFFVHLPPSISASPSVSLRPSSVFAFVIRHSSFVIHLPLVLRLSS